MVGVRGETQQAPELPKRVSQLCFRNGQDLGGGVTEDKDRTEGEWWRGCGGAEDEPTTREVPKDFKEQEWKRGF